jgi:hypothetical protein
MVDDHPAARPQSGLSQASVVWHAPAEFGIPRYMLVFGDTVPGPVGGVRSARDYFIAWAAEWRGLYAHVGGSPGARRTLREQGNGELVYDADQYDHEDSFWRVGQFAIPHNMYTDGAHLRDLAERVGALDYPLDAIPEPVWQFAPDAPRASRPTGGSIAAAFPANAVRYDYDADTNSYLRSVSGGRAQYDAATGARVAPKNVVVMLVDFQPLNDGSNQRRLEAQVVGRGTAWIATNGRTVKGTWRKASISDPTLFFDAAGAPATLTAGQTFVQVVPVGTRVAVVSGR